MLDEFKERITGMLARVELSPDAPPEADFQPAFQNMVESHPDPAMAMAMAGAGMEMGAEMGMAGAEPVLLAQRPIRMDAVDPNDPSTWANTPRNALCPCGSGKKFKYCHGRV